MDKYGFLIDLTVCIGCHSCQYACSEKNNLPENEWFRRVFHIESDETKKGGFTGAYSAGCAHCINPACVSACQNGAMYRSEEKGVVLHNADYCIGCGACTWACPYGAVSLNHVTGKAQKCTSCLENREAGEVPACVAACPTECIKFGKIEELEKTGADVLNLDFLPESSITDPSVRILGGMRNVDEE